MRKSVILLTMVVVSLGLIASTGGAVPISGPQDVSTDSCGPTYDGPACPYSDATPETALQTSTLNDVGIESCGPTYDGPACPY